QRIGRNRRRICLLRPRRSLAQLCHGRTDFGYGRSLGAGHHRGEPRAHRALVQRGRVMMLGNGSIMRTRRAEPGLTASKGPRLGAWLRALFVCLLAFSTTLPAVAAQKQKQSDLGTILKPPSVDKSEPMLLQADEMIYDNENNRVTAKGNVEIYYGNYTLLADQVIYDRNANTLAAQGNVRIKDPEGAIITSNQMTLTDDFRDGFIDALRVVTKDDTRIVAQ